MQIIISAIFGVFIGMAIAGYMAVETIAKKDRKIANQKAMINNRDDLIERHRSILTEIEKLSVTQQFGSVENLQNKIKSALSTKYDKR